MRSLPLVYCEPQTDEPFVNDAGFALAFVPKTVMVAPDDTLIRTMIDRAHEILTAGIPEKIAGCEECEKMEVLFAKCSI